MSDIRLVHLADIHLGYTGSISLVFKEGEKAAGRYVREVDIEEAVKRMVRDLVRQQPHVDVVVIAGDLFNKSTPYPRSIRCATWMVRTLIQHDIEVVIIDGNHETSNSPHPGSPTTFLQELGAYVINGAQYEVIRDGMWHTSRLREQERFAIHALPCRVVRENAFTGISPLPGYINVLVAHGRVQDMHDFNSPRFKEPSIPQDLLRRGWHYIALGDWHTHRYQPLQGVPAYYAGSLEALNFGEATRHPPAKDDPHQVHGAIDVRLSLGNTAVVSTLPNTQRRPVLRLRAIDAADLDADALMSKLRQRLDSQMPAEALVLLEVKDCTVKTWEQLDHEEIDQLRKQVRRCDIRWTLKQPPEVGQSAEGISQVSLDDQWQHFLEQRVEDNRERAWYIQRGMKQIENARQQLAEALFQAGEERE